MTDAPALGDQIWDQSAKDQQGHQAKPVIPL